LEKLRGGNHPEDRDVDRKIVLERILGKLFGKLCTEYIWLTTRASGGIVWTR